MPEEKIIRGTRAGGFYMHFYGPSTYIEYGSITSLVCVDVVSKEVKLQWLLLAPFLLSGLTSGKGTRTVALLGVEGRGEGGRGGGGEGEGKKEGTSMGDRIVISFKSQDHTCSNCRDADRC